MSSVVSVRIRKEVKQALEEAGVDVNEEVKRFLEELAWKVTVKKNLEAMDAILRKMPPAPRGFSAKSVREDRDGR